MWGKNRLSSVALNEQPLLYPCDWLNYKQYKHRVDFYLEKEFTRSINLRKKYFTHDYNSNPLAVIFDIVFPIQFINQ